jgi:hypothetical protein
MPPDIFQKQALSPANQEYTEPLIFNAEEHHLQSNVGSSAALPFRIQAESFPNTSTPDGAARVARMRKRWRNITYAKIVAFVTNLNDYNRQAGSGRIAAVPTYHSFGIRPMDQALAQGEIRQDWLYFMDEELNFYPQDHVIFDRIEYLFKKDGLEQLTGSYLGPKIGSFIVDALNYLEPWGWDWKGVRSILKKNWNVPRLMVEIAPYPVAEQTLRGHQIYNRRHLMFRLDIGVIENFSLGIYFGVLRDEARLRAAIGKCVINLLRLTPAIKDKEKIAMPQWIELVVAQGGYGAWESLLGGYGADGRLFLRIFTKVVTTPVVKEIRGLSSGREQAKRIRSLFPQIRDVVEEYFTEIRQEPGYERFGLDAGGNDHALLPFRQDSGNESPTSSGVLRNSRGESSGEVMQRQSWSVRSRRLYREFVRQLVAKVFTFIEENLPAELKGLTNEDLEAKFVKALAEALSAVKECIGSWPSTLPPSPFVQEIPHSIVGLLDHLSNETAFFQFISRSVNFKDTLIEQFQADMLKLMQKNPTAVISMSSAEAALIHLSVILSEILRRWAAADPASEHSSPGLPTTQELALAMRSYPGGTILEVNGIQYAHLGNLDFERPLSVLYMSPKVDERGRIQVDAAKRVSNDILAGTIRRVVKFLGFMIQGAFDESGQDFTQVDPKDAPVVQLTVSYAPGVVQVDLMTPGTRRQGNAWAYSMTFDSKTGSAIQSEPKEITQIRGADIELRMFVLAADVLSPLSRQAASDILREIGIKALEATDPGLDPGDRAGRIALQVKVAVRLAQLRFPLPIDKPEPPSSQQMTLTRQQVRDMLPAAAVSREVDAIFREVRGKSFDSEEEARFAVTKAYNRRRGSPGSGNTLVNSLLANGSFKWVFRFLGLVTIAVPLQEIGHNVEHYGLFQGLWESIRHPVRLFKGHAFIPSTPKNLLAGPMNNLLGGLSFLALVLIFGNVAEHPYLTVWLWAAVAGNLLWVTIEPPLSFLLGRGDVYRAYWQGADHLLIRYGQFFAQAA